MTDPCFAHVDPAVLKEAFTKAIKHPQPCPLHKLLGSFPDSLSLDSMTKTYGTSDAIPFQLDTLVTGALPGKWFADFTMGPGFSGWKDPRVSMLMARHSSVAVREVERKLTWQLAGMLYIDSAHGAILDVAAADDPEAYLESWGEVWNPSNGVAWLYPHGVVSSSNLGDGFYPVRAWGAASSDHNHTRCKVWLCTVQLGQSG